MKKSDIIRAWKDEDYRNNLSEAEKALMPPHPAGLIELNDIELSGAMGAEEEASSLRVSTLGCCGRTFYVYCGSYEIWTLGCCAAVL
ncbi:MAG TPA: mersacidin/lichenicidin family type 2 lantibiotic [Pyrinomonadaceae bacterium]|nr:mersacidin/lichenicidin family type 2 lantibiotic [Pyrinomonadaceae bacterium]